MSNNLLPQLFQKRWASGNFKTSNKFSEHDNYNLIQNYGEYIDTGYGKRYHEDRIHKSNDIFISKEAFTKRDKSAGSNLSLKSDQQVNNTFHKRFNRNYRTKVICSANVDKNSQLDLSLYLKQKLQTNAENSLNFESELFEAQKSSKLIATQPYRQYFRHPWKFSYKTQDYQTCTEQFRRVKSTCIDLSKY